MAGGGKDGPRGEASLGGDLAEVICAFAKGLSHPERERIFAIALGAPPISPSEACAGSPLTLQAICYHFKRLVDLGLIELAYETRVRGAAVEHHYRATHLVVFSLELLWGLSAFGLPGIATRYMHSPVVTSLRAVSALRPAAGAFSGSGSRSGGCARG